VPFTFFRQVTSYFLRNKRFAEAARQSKAKRHLLKLSLFINAYWLDYKESLDLVGFLAGSSM